MSPEVRAWIRARLEDATAAIVLAWVVGACLGAMILLFGCSSPTHPTDWTDPYADARPYLTDPNTVKGMLP